MKISVFAFVTLSIFGQYGVFAAPLPKSETSIVSEKFSVPVIENVVKHAYASDTHMATKFIKRGVVEQPIALTESEWTADKGTFDEFKKSGKLKQIVSFFKKLGKTKTK